jgi:hypothetical protein
MSNLFLVVASVGLTLAVLAVLSGAAKVRDHERRLAELERRANPASRHDLRALERHDIGEATLFDLAELRDLQQRLAERIEYASRRALHVASGGRPDDSPTKWGNGAPK